MSGLRISGLTCVKRDRVLFEALNFQLMPGELLYLRGPNGAGKTSLLRIITGLSEPESGEVCYDNTPIASSHSFLSALIYLGHKAGLNGALSAMDNLQFWLAQHGAEVAPSGLGRYPGSTTVGWPAATRSAKPFMAEASKNMGVRRTFYRTRYSRYCMA